MEREIESRNPEATFLRRWQYPCVSGPGIGETDPTQFLDIDRPVNLKTSHHSTNKSLVVALTTNMRLLGESSNHSALLIFSSSSFIFFLFFS